MKLNATEKAWLGWARKVIRSNGVQNRFNVCTQRRTKAFERVLWPGYIGKNYRPGGMLLVGAVHNREEFETHPIVQLASLAEKWARDAGTCSDEQYC